jgi:hypothetical protein
MPSPVAGGVPTRRRGRQRDIRANDIHQDATPRRCRARRRSLSGDCDRDREPTIVLAVILRGTVQAGRIVVEGASELNDGDEVMVVIRRPGADAPRSGSLWPAIAETLRLAERLGEQARTLAEPVPVQRSAERPRPRRELRGVVAISARR